MVVVNAISLLESSSFRDASQIPLPDDPPVEAQADNQSEDAKEEREDSPGMRELS